MAEERKGAVTMRGNPMTLVGPELKVGQKAPNFTVVGKGMAPATLDQFKGKVKIITTVPSLDTPVCDAETRRFNVEATRLRIAHRRVARRDSRTEEHTTELQSTNQLLSPLL